MSAEVLQCSSSRMVRGCEDVSPEFDGAIEKHDESVRPQVHLPYTSKGNLTRALTLNFTRTRYILPFQRVGVFISWSHLGVGGKEGKSVALVVVFCAACTHDSTK